MEPEGSSPHSQQPVTCPYPEPDQPSLRRSKYSLIQIQLRKLGHIIMLVFSSFIK
jgi:hypothetical protein